MAHAIEQIGSYAGLAAFLGLGVLALLCFTQARDIRRLRDWAGSAPERDAERKETTSTVAAQRAEELKALEEARTAEHDAVSQREQRRQRREEGLPELTRGERFRGFFSGFGERLAQPRWLAVIFVVLVLIVGGVAYALLSGSDEDAKGGSQGKQASAQQVKPSEVEVAVLNGTATPGLAATFGDQIESKGYQLGAVTNSDEPAETSVVMFTRGHRPEAKKVAKQLQISEVQMMTTDIKTDSGEASVAVIIGEDDAAETG
ncbi:MAG TPA: LytR C-terminal domain-containing protein [Solirubrobacterales bacterium]|nr:LytR C-terminal domain-containing protein [Solirubrobacterales bacterium]